MPKLSSATSEILRLSTVMMTLDRLHLGSKDDTIEIVVDQELRIALFDVARKHIVKSIKRGFHVKPTEVQQELPISVDDTIPFGDSVSEAPPQDSPSGRGVARTRKA